MNVAIAAGSAACLAVLVACGDRPAPDGSLPNVVVDPATIHVVGTSDAVARIEDLMPAADGAAWVLNNTEPFLVLLSADGRELRTLGRSGGGPGEFSWPSTLVRDPTTDALWVFDAAPGRLVRIPDGAEAPVSVWLDADAGTGVRLSSYDYLWMSNGGRSWIEGTDDGFVFARPPPDLPWIRSLWNTDVVRRTPDGRLEPVLATAEVVGAPSPRFAGATRFLPYPMWAACPDGSLAVYDPNRNVLRRFSDAGASLSVHELPPERALAVSVERIFSTVYPGVLRNRLMADPPDREVLRDMVRADYERSAGEFAPVFPEFVHLDCGQGNTLWLQAFDAEAGQMGRGPHWLRIDAEGRTGRVEFPDTFRPMRFHGDRVWGVHTGQFDVEHVAWTEVAG